MRGIILAGGLGTRLYPATCAVNKQLLPVYDKPMIYYPLSVLMLAGIRDILIITRPNDEALYRAQLGDGSQWGLNFSYIAQPAPNGIAEAYILGRDFVGGQRSMLVLGDNLFYGHGLQELVTGVMENTSGSDIFAYPVRNPQSYGVVGFDADGRPNSIEEKPTTPKSRFAITGLYVFDGQASDTAVGLTPSPRGELEITDLIRHYLVDGTLNVVQLGRGYAWLDTGTHESLMQAGAFVHAIEERQGLKIACGEEIAFLKGYIDQNALAACAVDAGDSSYGDYLRALLE